MLQRSYFGDVWIIEQDDLEFDHIRSSIKIFNDINKKIFLVISEVIIQVHD